MSYYYCLTDVDISCQSSDIAITDGSATSTLMSTYMVGETVTFTCDQIAMTREKTLTCNSDGTWTPIDSVCSGATIVCGMYFIKHSLFIEHLRYICINKWHHVLSTICVILDLSLRT